ncbi:MAG TPA: hypothetical protein VGF45_18575 [Polyangia bacterium]
MSSRASTWVSLGSVAIAALMLAGGCDGGESSNTGTDGGISRPDGTTGPDIMVGNPGGRPDMAPGAIETRPPAPPPEPNRAAVKILPTGTSLLGGITVGCSYGPASTAAGTRWCAFAIPGARLGSFELWALNMNKAGASTAQCTGAGTADCLKVSDKLFSAAPMVGPRFPTAHRFYGDTLIFHANETSAPGDAYTGPVYAWQPGWPAAKQVSQTTNAFRCVGHTRAPVVVCLENLSETDPLTFDLTAGKIDGTGTASKIAKIFPSHPTETQSSQWGAAFTVDGNYLLYSTGLAAVPPATTPIPETLFYIETSKIGVEAPKQVGESGLSEWSLSPDQTKWFYLRQYNYNGTNPSGTLYMADFPTGANEVRIFSDKIRSGSSGGIAAYNVVPTADNKLGFLAIVQNYNANNSGVGEYLLLKNPAAFNDPTSVSVLKNDIAAFPVNSPDLKYGWYFQNQSMTLQGITDSRIIKNDGTGTCPLTTQATASLFGAPFLENSALTFWVENYNQETDTGDGMLASPADCTSKRRRFATGVDFWFIKGDEQMVYSDAVSPDALTSTLRVARVTNGDLGAPVDVQKQIERFFQVLPNQEGLIYQIKSGSSPTVDGIYFYKIGAGAGADGGVDAGADAGVADAAPGN